MCPYNWITLHNNCIIPFQSQGDIEPCVMTLWIIHRYGVFRRSALDPIFNPYFIDYGYDKIEFFRRIDLFHSSIIITSYCRIQVLHHDKWVWSRYSTYEISKIKSIWSRKKKQYYALSVWKISSNISCSQFIKYYINIIYHLNSDSKSLHRSNNICILPMIVVLFCTRNILNKTICLEWLVFGVLLWLMYSLFHNRIHLFFLQIIIIKDHWPFVITECTL